jgi:hypothetical protein
MLILIEGVPDVYCPLDVEGAAEAVHTKLTTRQIIPGNKPTELFTNHQQICENGCGIRRRQSNNFRKSDVKTKRKKNAQSNLLS